jgi:soluble lytic murein transglycosylase
MKKTIKITLVLLLIAAVTGLILWRFFPKTDPATMDEYEQYAILYSKAYGLDPALIMGVIKAESNFDTNATSHQDARGLMQITEPTLKWAIAREDHQADYRAEDLYDPEVNIKYGCLILSMLMEEFEDQNTALAAYNAGHGNVQKWLKDRRYSDDGKTIRTTPYRETNDYIKKIERYQKDYRKEMGETP